MQLLNNQSGHFLAHAPGRLFAEEQHEATGAATRWRQVRLAFAAAAALLASATLHPVDSFGATGTLYARGVTSPGGQVWMKNHLWVADHALGFCRADPNPAAAIDINQDTCNGNAVSPGQPSFDASHNLVYVPDNSTKGQGVWRLTFDPNTETVGNAVLIGGKGSQLAGKRATASALGPDGALYVGFLRDGSILRIVNPSGPSPTVQSVGKTSDGRGISSIAFAGAHLYLAEGGAVTKIANAALCAGACVAQHVAGINAAAPTAIGSDGSNTLFVAETGAADSNILRYTISTDTLDIYANASTDGTPFQSATGLSLDASGNLFVGDDPTNGAQILKGRVWEVASGQAPLVAGAPGAPATPPAGPALTTGTLFARGVTSPGGMVWMKTRLWVADHALGFCRIDPNPAAAIDVNQDTCSTDAISPGQPTFDASHNLVYVPDNSTKGQGVWRLTFNDQNETVGSPVLLSGGGLAGNRATASALGPDGALYVGFIKNGNILRVVNPNGASPTVQTVGKTSDGRGVSSFAFAGADLYVAQGGAVTKIANAALCAGACVAQAVVGITAAAPTAIASSGTLLFIADTPGSISTVLRYTITSNTLEAYANASSDGTPFQFATGLTLDPSGNLYVGDDPSDGAQILQGHVWKVAPAP